MDSKLTTFENMIQFDLASFRRFKSEHHVTIENISNNSDMTIQEKDFQIKHEEMKYMFVLENILESMITGMEICHPVE